MYSSSLHFLIRRTLSNLDEHLLHGGHGDTKTGDTQLSLTGYITEEQ